MKKFWKSDKDSPAAPTDNPYAQQGQPPDTYGAGRQDPMAAYQRGGGLPSGPRAGGLPGRPTPRGNGGYGGPPAPSAASSGYGSSTASMSSTSGYSSSKGAQSSSAGGYGSDKYGASGGYGSNRYDNSRSQSSGRRGPGGYGGLGGDDDNQDASRDALFGNKQRQPPPQQNRYQQQPSQGGPRPGPGYGGGVGRNQSDTNRDALFGGARERLDVREQAERDNLYGSGQSAVGGGSYGGYGEERVLTEEEKQEMQIRAVHDKTRQIRQDDIDSLARTEQLGLQSLEIVQSSIARLGHQNDRLALAEKNLDKAISQNEETRVHVNDLKRINNGGMLSSLAKNPFAKGRRQQEREAAAVRRREEAAEAAEETRQGQIAMNSQTARLVGDIQKKRNKYEYEDDDDISRDDLDQAYLQDGATDEDYGQEKEIEKKLRSIEFISSGLNDASRQLNKFIDDSAPQLERTARKVEKADMGISKNYQTMREVR